MFSHTYFFVTLQPKAQKFLTLNLTNITANRPIDITMMH